jgi:imidazolonepropionase-like amidohydrolase
MTAKLSIQPPLARTCLTAVVAAALVAISAGSAAQAPANNPVQPHDRRPFLAPGARTSDDPVRIPLRPVAETGPELVIRGGRLFDSVSGGTRPATVVIQGNRIKAVLPADSTGWGADARIIDAAGKTVMPGLIDMHTHVTYPDRATPIDEQASEGGGTLRGQRNLRYFLESGFTSVRDLNGVSNAPFLLSEWSAAGMIPAPRVFAAGWIITGTGGHATERPVSPSHGPDYAKEVDGPDAWRAMVRKAFKEGASVIKIASHFAPDEVRAGIEEAHLLGLKVTCDCETIYTEMAVDAGIDMIEHPLPRSDAAIAKMAKKKIAAVPTLQVYQNLLDRAGGFYGSTSRRFTMTSQGNFDEFKKMKAAGIVMGIGTDSIGDASLMVPNSYIAELKWFVRGGYSVTDALKAGTIVNARLLDMGDELGSIEPGKLADIIVVDGRPDENLDDLSRVEHVVKDGQWLIENGRLVTPRHVSTPLVKPSPPADLK